MAGYSGTPLLKKLGIKEGHRVVVRNAPVSAPEELMEYAEARKGDGLDADKLDVAVVFAGSALTTAFVDVKVCAIDETWSGLKLVVRKERRTGFAAETRAHL